MLPYNRWRPSFGKVLLVRFVPISKYLSWRRVSRLCALCTFALEWRESLCLVPPDSYLVHSGVKVDSLEKVTRHIYPLWRYQNTTWNKTSIQINFSYLFLTIRVSITRSLFAIQRTCKILVRMAITYATGMRESYIPHPMPYRITKMLTKL